MVMAIAVITNIKNEGGGDDDDDDDDDDDLDTMCTSPGEAV